MGKNVHVEIVCVRDTLGINAHAEIAYVRGAGSACTCEIVCVRDTLGKNTPLKSRVLEAVWISMHELKLRELEAHWV